jgi:hypothetical protein
MSTPITEESAQAFFAANPRIAEDQHNSDLVLWWADYLRQKDRQDELTIENLAKFLDANKENVHWLRDPAEIQNAAQAAAQAEAARIAALPPEPKKPDKLKGLTTAERLGSLGIMASQHQSHSDKSANDQKQRNLIAEMARDANRMQQEKARQAAIAEARSIIVYRPGPGGRIDHGQTQDQRRKTLKALGISE